MTFLAEHVVDEVPTCVDTFWTMMPNRLESEMVNFIGRISPGKSPLTFPLIENDDARLRDARSVVVTLTPGPTPNWFGFTVPVPTSRTFVAPPADNDPDAPTDSRAARAIRPRRSARRGLLLADCCRSCIEVVCAVCGVVRSLLGAGYRHRDVEGNSLTTVWCGVGQVEYTVDLLIRHRCVGTYGDADACWCVGIQADV